MFLLFISPLPSTIGSRQLAAQYYHVCLYTHPPSGRRRLDSALNPVRATHRSPPGQRRSSAAAPRLSSPLGASSLHAQGTRLSSSISHAPVTDEKTLGIQERLQKFAPVEIAPLVAAVATVSAFAFVNIYWAFQRPEGELRLVPGRLNKKHQEVPPWEDERALQGKW